MKLVIVGAIVMCFLIPLCPLRYAPFLFFVFAVFSMAVVGWAYHRQESDSFACTEADGKTLCAFKGKPQEPQEYVCEKVDGNMLCKRSRKTTIRYKGETYALHYFDGKEVYVAE